MNMNDKNDLEVIINNQRLIMGALRELLIHHDHMPGDVLVGNLSARLGYLEKRAEKK